MQRLQQQNDMERQSLLGTVDQDGDDVESNHLQSPDEPAHATILDNQSSNSTTTSGSNAEGVEMSSLPPAVV